MIVKQINSQCFIYSIYLHKMLWMIPQAEFIKTDDWEEMLLWVFLFAEVMRGI